MSPGVHRHPRYFGYLAVAAAFLVTALSGCGRGKGSAETPVPGAATQRVGSFRISVENKPARPAVGDNVILIAVRDSSGHPVRGAEVKVLISMPAMGAMPRMESRGEVQEVGAGTYAAKYGLAMAGEWDVTIAVRSTEGAEAAADFRLSTSTKAIVLAGGGEAGDTTGPGIVRVDPARREAIGVRTAPIARRRLAATIRAAGRVAYDETRRSDISLKFAGWVREIFVDYTGKFVRAGDPLLTVYSPELLTAQQEYLEALRTSPVDSQTQRARDPDFAASARQRLLLWDVSPGQIDAIARSEMPIAEVPILAPAGGVVVEKNVVRGSAFTSGQTLYKIAPVDPVWVVASVYQYELPLVREGMGATIAASIPGQSDRHGRVSYINPYLDPETRTGEVRVEVPNPRGDLKPGMYVDVALERDLGERLAVPESAVLYSGGRRIVFVDLGDGRLAPRDVTLGAKAGDYYEVLGGLQAGEFVVTSGNFLIAAESKLRSAASKF